jgi:hypothetical protein
MVRRKPSMMRSRPTGDTDSVHNRIGCYREVPERALSDKQYPSNEYNVTVELCAEFGSFGVVVYPLIRANAATVCTVCHLRCQDATQYR